VSLLQGQDEEETSFLTQSNEKLLLKNSLACHIR
jgi:hypothetical protein